jgi:gag-polypeptide of LTR copia-type/GAG-pre-integrase domain
MQAAVREVIYRTVDNTTFLQVKNESNAAAIWKKVASIHADKGSLYETNLLMQLQNTCYAEGESMRDHIAKMTELREWLAEMNTLVSDESFVSYLRTSLSLAPSFRTLFTTLSATAHQMGKKLTPTDVIWHLTEEATSAEIEDSINKSNAAMLAATFKAKSRNSRSSKNDILCTNTNCGRRGHTKDQCWSKGGGKEGQGPDWWKTAGKQASANIVESTPTSDEPENYAMLTYNVPDDPTALVCTSDFHSEAHAISNHAGTILDSGASRHFSPDRSKFLNYQELVNPEPIRAADGRTFSALGKGDIQVELPNGDQKPTPITLKNAYYSPHMAFTLMSVSCVDQAGYSLFIKGGTCIICSPKSNIIGRIPEVRGLYHVSDSLALPRAHVASAAVKQISISELHQQMGHINHEDLRQMVEKGMVTGINLDLMSKPEFCEACIKAKAMRKPFPKESKTEYKSYGDKVVSDLWGPAAVQSIGGKRYSALFQDLHSHEELVYFLRQKSETFANYKKCEAWVKVQRGGQIRIVGCDRGGEFLSKEFTEHLENAGTVHHLTVHDSPASNGTAERANRTHIEGAQAMMEAAGLLKNLWAEAVRHHVWIRNRVPSRALPEMKTPHEMGTGEKLDLSAVRA